MKTFKELRDRRLREALEAVKSEVVRISGGDARLILYGSYARGEGREDSDVDIMVVVPDVRMNFQYQDRIRDVIHDIGLEEDFLFQVMIVTESQVEKFRGFMVFDSVEKEGMLI